MLTEQAIYAIFTKLFSSVYIYCFIWYNILFYYLSTLFTLINYHSVAAFGFFLHIRVCCAQPSLSHSGYDGTAGLRHHHLWLNCFRKTKERKNETHESDMFNVEARNSTHSRRAVIELQSTLIGRIKCVAQAVT